MSSFSWEKNPNSLLSTIYAILEAKSTIRHSTLWRSTILLRTVFESERMLFPLRVPLLVDTPRTLYFEEGHNQGSRQDNKFTLLQRRPGVKLFLGYSIAGPVKVKLTLFSWLIERQDRASNCFQTCWMAARDLRSPLENTRRSSAKIPLEIWILRPYWILRNTPFIILILQRNNKRHNNNDI